MSADASVDQKTPSESSSPHADSLAEEVSILKADRIEFIKQIKQEKSEKEKLERQVSQLENLVVQLAGRLQELEFGNATPAAAPTDLTVTMQKTFDLAKDVSAIAAYDVLLKGRLPHPCRLFISQSCIGLEWSLVGKVRQKKALLPMTHVTSLKKERAALLDRALSIHGVSSMGVGAELVHFTLVFFSNETRNDAHALLEKIWVSAANIAAAQTMVNPDQLSVCVAPRVGAEHRAPLAQEPKSGRLRAHSDTWEHVPSAASADTDVADPTRPDFGTAADAVKLTEVTARFHSLFDLPREDYVAEYAAILYTPLPVVGTLFVAKKHLCFNGRKLLTEITKKIDVKTIASLRPTRTGVELLTKSGEDLQFSLSKRDEALPVLTRALGWG